MTELERKWYSIFVKLLATIKNMKNIFSNKKKNFLIISVLTIFIVVSGVFIYFSRAQYYFSQSFLKNSLQVMDHGVFGGGVSTGYNLLPSQVGLAVLNGKVGIGTSNPTSLLTVNGDLEVRGQLKFELDCPLFLGAMTAVYGRKSWPGQSLVRYSGMVPPYGVYVDENSSGDDERLVWSTCIRGGFTERIGYPLPYRDTIAFQNVKIADGSLSTMLFGPSTSFSPSGISYASPISSGISAYVYGDVNSRQAFCQELGLQLNTDLPVDPPYSLPPGTTCRKFNTANNRWETIYSCSSYVKTINCRL